MTNAEEDFTPPDGRIPYPARNGSVRNDWLAEYLRAGFADLKQSLAVLETRLRRVEERTLLAPEDQRWILETTRILAQARASELRAAEGTAKAIKAALANAFILAPASAAIGVGAEILARLLSA